MTYTTFDIETTTKLAFKRKASPFVDDNWTVLVGWKKKGDLPGQVHKHYFGKARPFAGWLKPILAGTRLLVGFNIKFDLLHALQDAENLELWMAYVAGGGMVWDCQLAEYLLQGMTQENHWLSLDDVSARYGGDLKVDEVKALWNAGVNTPDIDPELLDRYLCGGNDEFGDFKKGDVENTELIALAQIKRARECGQMNSLLLNMGSLLCSIEMERNGMYVDKPRALVLAAALKIKVEELTKELEKYLPEGLPFPFNWNSPRHKSGLIFGGTVNYDSREYVHADGTSTLCDVWEMEKALGNEVKPLQYTQMDVVCVTVADLWNNAELAISAGDVIPLETAKAIGIPVERFAGGKQAGEVKTKKVKKDDLSKPKARNCKAPYTFAGYTEPSKEWEGAVPGVYSTASEVIEALGNRDVAFLKVMAELTKLAKDLGTYYISEEFDEEGNVIGAKGMLTLVGLDGIIHHSVNHVATVTARFSSSDPNL